MLLEHRFGLKGPVVDLCRHVLQGMENNLPEGMFVHTCELNADYQGIDYRWRNDPNARFCLHIAVGQRNGWNYNGTPLDAWWDTWLLMDPLRAQNFTNPVKHKSGEPIAWSITNTEPLHRVLGTALDYAGVNAEQRPREGWYPGFWFTFLGKPVYAFAQTCLDDPEVQGTLAEYAAGDLD